MRILVIGGSVFVGRAVVDEAVALGADVTVLNRGVSGAPPPDGVEQLIGDRTRADDLEPLRGRPFDLVVDTCGYVPADVALSAELLAPSVGHYAFVSSISVYPGWPADLDHDRAGTYDGDPDATAAPDDLDPAASYGWLKVGCERAVTRAFGPDRRSLLRGGLIVGPRDGAIGRLPWWIDRVARGGEVLVPGTPTDPVALIDSRDLAQFALRAVPGVFQTPGPTGRDTRADLLAACVAATGSDATFTYVEDDWLAGQGVRAFTEVPLWIPPSVGPSVFHHHSADAEAAGLAWRPLAETVADTWAWQRTVRGGWRPSTNTPGLAADRERELLAAWRTV